MEFFNRIGQLRTVKLASGNDCFSAIADICELTALRLLLSRELTSVENNAAIGCFPTSRLTGTDPKLALSISWAAPLKFRELDTTSLDGERIVTIDCRHIQNLRGSDGRAER